MQLGCLDNCGTLTFDVSGTLANDLFRLEVDFLNAKISLFCLIENDGDKPIFNLSELNENYTFKGQLYKNNVPVVLVDAQLIEYDCVAFQTVFSNWANNTQTEPLTIL